MRPGEPSVTARRVAAQRLEFERVPVAYGDAAAEEALARNVAGDLAGMPPGPMSRYLAARTLFFDRFVVRGLETGIDQVVVLAAGYDGRAFRYARAGTRWFEVDHPDTQRDKVGRVGDLGLDTAHITFVPADFGSDQVDEALIGAGLDSGARALFLCEGVAVYLELSVLETLLSGVRRVAAPGSRLAISVSVNTPDQAGMERRQRFRARVALIGEEARTVLEPGAADALLERLGWQPEVGGAGSDGPVVSDASVRLRMAGLITAVAG